jgi:hypothetical protein
VENRNRRQAQTESCGTETQQFSVFQRKHHAMTYALFRPLFSTKILIRVAFASLSLHSMGTAFGQGLAAGTTAPLYGTTWAAAHARSHVQDARVMASEQRKHGQAAASATADRDASLSSRRTGG